MALFERYLPVPRRVVVSGVHFISALGEDMDAAFDAMERKQTGIKPFDHPQAHFAGSVPHEAYETATKLLDRKELFHASRAQVLSQSAITYALRDAGLLDETGGILPEIDRERVSMYIGTGLGGVADDSRAKTNIFVQLPERVATGPRVHFGIQGETVVYVQASTSGIIAIGNAARNIAIGHVDFAIAGGVEAALQKDVIAGFDGMGAISKKTKLDELSMPFDLESDGINLGEGAGMLILETPESAYERGVEPIAEVIGYGYTDLENHRSSVHPEGYGLVRAMQRATNDIDSFLQSGVSYVVYTHGSGNLHGDVPEAKAVGIIFSDHIRQVQGVGFKGYVGHQMGAAGAVSTAAALEGMRRSFIPPSLHRRLRPEVTFNLSQDPQEIDKTSPHFTIVWSMALGGQNAALVFAPYQDTKS